MKLHLISRGQNKWALKFEGRQIAHRVYFNYLYAILNSIQYMLKGSIKCDELIIHDDTGRVVKIIKIFDNLGDY